MAHYSSLFTLGLLSDRASPPPSPKSNVFYQFRKSSLPTSALSRPSDISASTSGGHHPPQFSNPFADSPDATTELRSFLSLDLAADTSLAARRSDKLLLPLDTTSPPSSADFPPRHLPVPKSPLSISPGRRSSRDSLRTLPSPRPAPSSALPELPSERKGPPTLPPILIPNPSLFPPPSSASLNRSRVGSSPTSFRPPLSAPPGTSSSFVQTPSPTSSLSSPRLRSPRYESFISFSSVTSIRTARRRNMERSNALACLEGRSRSPGRIARSVRQRNFMSMSDDEDEEAGGDEDTAGDADVEDDSDAPEPPPRGTFRSLAAVLTTSAPNPSTGISVASRFPIDEEEDRVLPAPAAIPSHMQTASSKPKSRSRRGTLESWFPLANFIDLKDDELQGWRGVVEIVNGL